ncbi:dihydroneopterin triphosphate diphosphatase [Zobellella endophytica]|uniref:Dihydroneopterin triphosphate diphosphatase n=1 Tax=Zobellella endophytica TaxID=2116700 RepID=A0A2P7R757_9GAMM|nr:dihydroneopterin triphosphate diphosphatase [Zobellella endophytica]PSJ46048.1 dihydroneopterin triphosphate diphosphatase [Zobellella endophytica]
MAWKHPESVLVLIHTEDQVLLLQRKDNPDFWQSVTGSLEPGERRRQAAERELEEETGLRLDHGLQLVETGHRVRFEIYPRWRHRYRPGVTHNWEYEFCLCLPAPLEVQLSEHLTQRWLPLEEAMRTASSWTNRDAIGRLINRKNNGAETYGRS